MGTERIARTNDRLGHGRETSVIGERQFKTERIVCDGIEVEDLITERTASYQNQGGIHRIT